LHFDCTLLNRPTIPDSQKCTPSRGHGIVDTDGVKLLEIAALQKASRRAATGLLLIAS
jgi:hypothetical protein